MAGKREQKKEIWIKAFVFGWRYEVSSHGRVRGLYNNFGPSGKYKILKTQLGPDGYHRITLKCGRKVKPRTFTLHRLVLASFTGINPADRECAHSDGIKSNCKLSNLSWKTHIENESDKLIHGTRLRGEDHPASKISDESVFAIRRMIKNKELSQTKIALLYGISIAQVSRIKHGKRRQQNETILSID